MEMKNIITAVLGVAGSFIAHFLGGWDTALQTLVLFMAADYITGLIVAGVFHQSNKTENGALESKAGLKGIIRKGMMLLMVLVAEQLDIVMGTDIVRNAVIIALVTNEVISLIENIGATGVDIPKPLANAIEMLQKKGEKE